MGNQENEKYSAGELILEIDSIKKELYLQI